MPGLALAYVGYVGYTVGMGTHENIFDSLTRTEIIELMAALPCGSRSHLSKMVRLLIPTAGLPGDQSYDLYKGYEQLSIECSELTTDLYRTHKAKLGLAS